MVMPRNTSRETRRSPLGAVRSTTLGAGFSTTAVAVVAGASMTGCAVACSAMVLLRELRGPDGGTRPGLQRSLRRGRRLGGVGLIAVRVEPLPQVQLGPQEVRGLRAGPMPLIVEANHGGGDLPNLQGFVKLFGLADRRAQVVDTGHEHGRRLHVAHVHERG